VLQPLECTLEALHNESRVLARQLVTDVDRKFKERTVYNILSESDITIVSYILNYAMVVSHKPHN
jgi:hypothetical protein